MDGAKERIARRIGGMEFIKNNTFALGVLCIAIISLVMVTCESSWNEEASSKNGDNKAVSIEKVKDNQASDTKDHKVTVFYFHGNVRCYTCNLIEHLTSEAVEEAFGEEMKNGVVEWKVINVEEAENEHFIEDYQLYTKSVIVSDLIQGKQERWKNLERVWQLIRNDAAFKEYIQKEVREYLIRKQS